MLQKFVQGLRRIWLVDLRATNLKDFQDRYLLISLQ